MTVLDKNIPILYYFEEISKIPRGSGNEKEIADYIVSIAKKHNLRYVRDAMDNVIIYKDASKGYEDHASLMLEGHMDMVNEKNKDSNHDFDHDPLDLYIEDGFLHARKTTLGADDGYGVCYMLALLTDDTLKHPPLECVFTVQEEIGLCGALGLDTSVLNSKRMIGLDSEQEGETCTTSSGGSDLLIDKMIHYEKEKRPIYVLEVKGLLGGHSGECIDQGRGNANKIAARIMYYLLKENKIYIKEIKGGLKNNAIPRECTISFSCKESFVIIKDKVAQFAFEIQNELKESDPNLVVTIHEEDHDYCINEQESKDIISILYLGINGVMAKSRLIPGLTTASLNMGVVSTKQNNITINYSIRSPLQSIRNELRGQLELLATTFGASILASNDYPGWDYDPNSLLRKQFSDFYFQYTNQTLKEVATHGGLETGVFKDKIPELDIITMGPNMADIHTPDERLDLASYQKTYDLLVEFIKTL